MPSKGIAATRYEGTHAEPAGAAVFFEVQGGLMPALNPRSELAKDAKVPDTPASSPEFSLAHLATSRQEVDDLLRQAEAAGATVPGTR